MRFLVCTLKIWLVLFLISGLYSCRSEHTEAPNILLAIADDWSWPHASIAGTKEIQTPAFDRIASEGILFTHAYCSSPSCTPSRGAILTGQYHWRLKENANLWSTLSEEFKVYPDLLEANGYKVGYTGKGWGPGMWDAGNRTRNPAGPEYNEHRLESPKGVNTIDYFKNFKNFLKEKEEQQPFCFWYGSFEPHRAYHFGIGVKKGKNIHRIEVPAIFPDHDSIRSDIADYFTEIEWFDAQLTKMIDLLEELGELDNTIIIVTSDNGMPFPRAKSNLYDLGTNMPLAIRFGNKIKRGRTILDFVCLTDLAPTILEAVGLDIPKEMSGKSLIPMLRSGKSGWIEDSRDHVLTGKERHAWVRKGGLGYPMRAIRTKDFLYIYNFKPDRWPAGDPENVEELRPSLPFGDIDGSPTKTFMISHSKEYAELFGLGFLKRATEELYDLNKDPDQLYNIAGNMEYQHVKKQLNEKLMKGLKESGDLRVLGIGEVYDQMPYYQRGFLKNLPNEKTK